MKQHTSHTVMIIVTKMTSAIDNIHELEGEKIFKGIVKKRINDHISWFNKVSRGVYDLYYQKDLTQAEYVAGLFDNVGDAYPCSSNPNQNNLLLFKCKLQSVVNDIDSLFINADEKIIADIVMYLQMVKERSAKLLNEKFWNQYSDCKSTIDQMDNYSRKIYMVPEEECNLSEKES